MPSNIGNSYNLMVQDTKKTWSAFTGADITAYMGNVQIATLEGITVSVTREVMPIFVMGDPSPKAFAKGKRAIAGSLIFSQFDKHAVLRYAKGVTTLYDLFSPSAQANVKQPSNVQTISDSFTYGSWQRHLNSDGTFDNISSALLQDINETLFLVSQRKAHFADQIPPFDVTITLVNENGDASYTAIHDVQLVNEGWGYSLDDISSQVSFTFLARDIDPLDSLADLNSIQSNTGGGAIV